MPPFISRPPVEVLQDILRFKKRKDKGEQIEIPLITITFHNRQAISGFLIDLKEVNTGAYQLSMEAEGSRDLVYTQSHSFQSVIIQDAEAIDHLLTEINSANAGNRRVVTRLEIKKTLADHGQALTLFFGKVITFQFEDSQFEGAALYFLKQVSIDLTHCLISIGEDKNGKEAVLAAVDRIFLKKSDTLKITLEHQALIFTDSFTRMYSTTQQRAFLHHFLTGIL